MDKITKHAVLWAAASNETDLPDDMEGAEDVDEEEEEDEGDRENLEGELGLLIAGAGVSLINLKAMDAAERSTHAAKCSADRSITAKAGSPRSPTRWGARPRRTRRSSVSSGSSTSTFSTHSLAFTCIHMHYGEAHETRLIMHAQCVRLHTNAVSMRQCANAAGRQNATHSTMHPNASVCSTDRM